MHWMQRICYTLIVTIYTYGIRVCTQHITMILIINNNQSVSTRSTYAVWHVCMYHGVTVQPAFESRSGSASAELLIQVAKCPEAAPQRAMCKQRPASCNLHPTLQKNSLRLLLSLACHSCSFVSWAQPVPRPPVRDELADLVHLLSSHLPAR